MQAFISLEGVQLLVNMSTQFKMGFLSSVRHVDRLLNVCSPFQEIKKSPCNFCCIIVDGQLNLLAVIYGLQVPAYQCS